GASLGARGPGDGLHDRPIHRHQPLPAGGYELMTRIATRLLTWLALAVAFVVFVFPLYYLVVTSLKTHAELFQAVPTLFPQKPTLQPYMIDLVDRSMGQL